MVLLRRIRPNPQASDAQSDEAAELAEAMADEQARRGEQNSPRVAAEPARQYRNINEVLADCGHNMEVENRLIVHPDALPYAVRDLVARGLTNESIQSEIGAASVATVRRLRAHLGCPDPDDVPPEAA